jgi:hypothetical protein
MSDAGWDKVYFSVEFDAPFNEGSLRAAFQAVREAVEDNWRAHSDRLSFLEPIDLVNVEQWLGDLKVNSIMEKNLRDQAAPTSAKPSACYESMEFRFSPVSCRLAEMTPQWVEGSRLRISVIVSDRVLREEGGERVWCRSGPPGFLGEYEADPFPPDAPWPLDEDDNFNPAYDKWAEAWFAPYYAPVGPANRACLLHILDKLSRALPVRHIQTTQNLRGDADREGEMGT